MKQKTFSVQARIKSFVYAWQGLTALLRTEHNAYIHLALTVIALLLSMCLRISAMELIALIITMALVWMAELFNTAIEKVADFVCAQKHPQIKLVKDVAAAAVMVTAVAALLTGCIIFLPKIYSYAQGINL